MTRGPRVAVGSLLALAVLLAVLVAMAPSLISQPSVRDWILASALPLEGKITIGAARLGWLSPLHFENLEVTDRQGRRALAVGVIDGDRPLWRVALQRSTPGNFRLEKVQVDVIVDPEGSNLARLIARDKLRGAATLGVEVVDAVLVIHKPGVAPWQLGPFHVGADLKADGPPSARELVIRPGTVLQKATITSPKSSDLLKYVMPVLAEANLSGQISLDLDGWRLPLGAPEKASGSGRLIIHRLDVEPGPLALQLSEALHHPATIRLAEETAVPFSMADGRIYHRDLKFTLRNLTLSTHGSVGVDQTIEIVAEVEFPHDPAKNRPLLDAMQKVSIPIGGTFQHPVIDRTALRDSGKDMLRDAIESLLRRGLEQSKQTP